MKKSELIQILQEIPGDPEIFVGLYNAPEAKTGSFKEWSDHGYPEFMFNGYFNDWFYKVNSVETGKVRSHLGTVEEAVGPKVIVINHLF